MLNSDEFLALLERDPRSTGRKIELKIEEGADVFPRQAREQFGHEVADMFTGRMLSVFVDDVDTGSRFFIDQLGSTDDWLAVLDQIHDAVIEEYWGEPWPRCPGHPHPMSLTISNDQLFWCCEATREPVVGFGDLT